MPNHHTENKSFYWIVSKKGELTIGELVQGVGFQTSRGLILEGSEEIITIGPIKEPDFIKECFKEAN